MFLKQIFAQEANEAARANIYASFKNIEFPRDSSQIGSSETIGTLSIDNEMARRRRAEVKIFPREGSAHVRCCQNVV